MNIRIHALRADVFGLRGAQKNKRIYTIGGSVLYRFILNINIGKEH